MRHRIRPFTIELAVQATTTLARATSTEMHREQDGVGVGEPGEKGGEQDGAGAELLLHKLENKEDDREEKGELHRGPDLDRVLQFRREAGCDHGLAPAGRPVEPPHHDSADDQGGAERQKQPSGERAVDDGGFDDEPRIHHRAAEGGGERVMREEGCGTLVATAKRKRVGRRGA